MQGKWSNTDCSMMNPPPQKRSAWYQLLYSKSSDSCDWMFRDSGTSNCFYRLVLCQTLKVVSGLTMGPRSYRRVALQCLLSPASLDAIKLYDFTNCIHVAYLDTTTTGLIDDGGLSYGI